MALEPDAYQQFPHAAPDPQALALVSIAVSLKRVADAIEGTESKLGLTDGVMSAIEQGIIAAGNR